jgi:hypothetical protein
MLKEQNALHTLIHQRHLTPSCGGYTPTAERTLNPARMFMESLTPGPELENSLGHSATCGSVRAMSVLTNSRHWMRRVYEYTPFCNGPDEVKSPSDRHAAELTLLSVVGAEAATLCCLRER